MLSRQDYIEGTTLQLDLWDVQFATLEERAARTLAAGRGDLRRRLAALQRKKRRLKRRLREASKAEASAWREKRKALEEDVERFRRAAGEVHRTWLRA